MTKIMDMPNGTKLRHKRTGEIFYLHDYASEYARLLISQQYITVNDYINANVQDDYEVVE